MKMLWKLTKEAARYKALYVLAIFSTLGLTLVNLTAPKLLSSMTGVVEKDVDDAALKLIMGLALGLLALYLLRILFRFLSNYLTHKAAWYLVGDLRNKLYNKLQSLDLGFFHDKQTGDLMSRVINDTRDFEPYDSRNHHQCGDFLRRADYSSDHQLETGVDHLLPHSPDSLLRCGLLQNRTSLLQGFPEKHGRIERPAPGQSVRPA